jgi:hypothetical protein
VLCVRPNPWSHLTSKKLLGLKSDHDLTERSADLTLASI